MFCQDCGTKLSLKFCENEGLVPYCETCGQFKFPPYSAAVSMVAVNKNQDKVLLAKHLNSDDFILFAGYIKKRETAEKAVVREMREEAKLSVTKYKYMSSKYHEPKNVLMFNFIAVVNENEPITIDANEIEKAEWFDFDTALTKIRQDSVAQFFLTNAIAELKRVKI